MPGRVNFLCLPQDWSETALWWIEQRHTVGKRIKLKGANSQPFNDKSVTEGSKNLLSEEMGCPQRSWGWTVKMPAQSFFINNFTSSQMFKIKGINFLNNIADITLNNKIHYLANFWLSKRGPNRYNNALCGSGPMHAHIHPLSWPLIHLIHPLITLSLYLHLIVIFYLCCATILLSFLFASIFLVRVSLS